MVDDKNDYSLDLKSLRDIAELFKKEVNETYRLVEELYTISQEQSSFEERKYQQFFDMAMVYLMRYLEIFNRKFFIELLTLRPKIMMKSQKSEKDNSKLNLSYKEILKDLIHGDPFDEIPRIMAGRMYTKIFSYDRMNFDIFIKKLLDDYLELDFTNESIRRRLELKFSLQSYKKYRNSIVHGTEKFSLKEENEQKFSVMELETLIIEYIRLVEELVYPKYFKKPEGANILDLSEI